MLSHALPMSGDPDSTSRWRFLSQFGRKPRPLSGSLLTNEPDFGPRHSNGPREQEDDANRHVRETLWTSKPRNRLGWAKPDATVQSNGPSAAQHTRFDSHVLSASHRVDPTTGPLPAYSLPPEYMSPGVDTFTPSRTSILLCAGSPVVLTGLDYPTLSLSSCQQGGVFQYSDIQLSRGAGEGEAVSKDATIRRWLGLDSEILEVLSSQESTHQSDTSRIYDLALTFGMGQTDRETNPLSKAMYSR